MTSCSSFVTRVCDGAALTEDFISGQTSADS